MQYIGEIAQIQQAASRTPDYAARRAATFEGLAPRAADRERQILDGWRKHAPFPNLPAVLRPRLVAAGFAVVRHARFACTPKPCHAHRRADDIQYTC